MSKTFENEFLVLEKEYRHNLSLLQPQRGLKDTAKFKNKVQWALDFVGGRLEKVEQIGFKVEYGNKKLPKTTIISSCGSWFNCSGRTKGFCSICGFCYDKSPEIRYKRVLATRIEKELCFRALDSQTLANQICKQVKKDTLLNRFNEVGEIRDNNDLKKLIEVSNILFEEKGVLSYVYTHNKSLDFNLKRDNLIINGSNFFVDNEFKVVESKEKAPKGFKECLCDCRNCNLCVHKGNTIVEILRK